jgi:hypothetical protein
MNKMRPDGPPQIGIAGSKSDGEGGKMRSFLGESGRPKVSHFASESTPRNSRRNSNPQ